MFTLDPSTSSLFEGPLPPLTPERKPAPQRIFYNMYTSTNKTKIRLPADFSSNRLKTKQFLQDVDLYFLINPTQYDTNQKKVAFALSFMNSGTAAAWKETKLQDYLAKSTFPTWASFKIEVDAAFSPISAAAEARMNLKNLAQDGPVDDYIAKFHILANSSGITQEEALIEFFLDGLKEEILKGILECQSCRKN